MREVIDRPRRLTLSTQVAEVGSVRVDVKDSGVGFSVQSTKRLFDAFYTTKAGGMGMGLSISRSIIETHCGRVWATLNGDGPGATFSFLLPQQLEGATKKYDARPAGSFSVAADLSAESQP
jgi:signal transduction histidine kinase